MAKKRNKTKKKDRKGIIQRALDHWKCHPWKDSIKAVILAITLAILAHPLIEFLRDILYKPSVTITFLNGNPIGNDCGNAAKPCGIFSGNNVVGGLIKNVNNQEVFVLTKPVGGSEYKIHRVCSRTSSSSDGDWRGHFFKCEEGTEVIKEFIVTIILSDIGLGECQTLDKIRSNIPQDSIFVKVNQGGDYGEQRASKTITPSLITPLSHLYADIYLGRTNSKQLKTAAMTITANLFYSGFKNRIVRAELDWGEGKGWEGIELHRQSEYHQVHHTFQTTGRKEVKYRVTDEMGEFVEVKDFIEIIKIPE